MNCVVCVFVKGLAKQFSLSRVRSKQGDPCKTINVSNAIRQCQRTCLIRVSHEEIIKVKEKQTEAASWAIRETKSKHIYQNTFNLAVILLRYYIFMVHRHMLECTTQVL